MRLRAGMTERGVRLIGIATLATLFLAVADLRHGVGYLVDPVTTRPGLDTATMVWLVADIVGAILGCVLTVVYLRHLFRSHPAPMSPGAWALSILLLGPFAMALYWWLHIRRPRYPALEPLTTAPTAEQDPHLFAASSVGPPGPP